MDVMTDGEVRVAKKKPAGKDGEESVTLQVSCKKKFSEWVHELAKADGRQISVLVRRSLRDYAQKISFKPPPEE